MNEDQFNYSIRLTGEYKADHLAINHKLNNFESFKESVRMQLAEYRYQAQRAEKSADSLEDFHKEMDSLQKEQSDTEKRLIHKLNKIEQEYKLTHASVENAFTTFKAEITQKINESELKTAQEFKKFEIFQKQTVFAVSCLITIFTLLKDPIVSFITK